MATLYIMSGLAFSGKSTLSRKIAESSGAKRIAFDEVWVETEKKQPIPQPSGWRFIRDISKSKIAEAINRGQSVVYDETNVMRQHRDELRELAKSLGAESAVIYLNTPLEVIRKRQDVNTSTRERHEVGEEKFQDVAKQLEVPVIEEDILEFTPTTDLNEFLERLKN